MYPGIILYANIFIWKNLTCRNQRTLPSALTLWFLTSYSVLMSSWFWLSGTSVTSKGKSNQCEWHVRYREGRQTQGLATEPMSAGHQCAWALWPCSWARGLRCRTFLSLPQLLVCLPAKPCGSWDRDLSKFYRIWKPNPILVCAFS